MEVPDKFPGTSVPAMVTLGEQVPFEQYSDEEILNTLGITGDAKLVMLRIHFLDGLTKKGCFASNDALADYLGLTNRPTLFHSFTCGTGTISGTLGCLAGEKSAKRGGIQSSEKAGESKTHRRASSFGLARRRSCS